MREGCTALQRTCYCWEMGHDEVRTHYSRRVPFLSRAAGQRLASFRQPKYFWIRDGAMQMRAEANPITRPSQQLKLSQSNHFEYCSGSSLGGCWQRNTDVVIRAHFGKQRFEFPALRFGAGSIFRRLCADGYGTSHVRTTTRYTITME